MPPVAPPTPANVSAAAAILRAGGLVGMPTETVYGLAAKADDPAAIARVFAAKARPFLDPLIVHVLALDPALVDLSAFGAQGRAALDRLIARGWPGPLTLVLPRTAAVPDLAASGLPTVAVRSPAHPVARALIAEAGPVVAPSANRFGRISPTTAAHVVAELGDRVDLVLDGGPCAVGVESTIVEVRPDGAVILLRPGGLPVEALGPLAPDAGPLRAPGGLASHYAPEHGVIVGDFASLPAEGTGALAFSADRGAVARARGMAPVEVPSEGGDPLEIAAGLFAALRRLDASGCARIAVEAVPSHTGLWLAVGDRLSRAAARRGPQTG
jgi:L-threonylcarbamoyladenylate synthase